MESSWLPYFEFRKNILEVQLKYIGLSIFDPHFKFNWLTAFYWIDISIFTIISCTDLYFFIGQLKEFVFCIVTLPFALFFAIRFYNLQFKRKLIVKLVQEAHYFCMKLRSEKRLVEIALFGKYAEYLKLIAIATNLLVLVAGSGSLILPFLMYPFLQELILPFGFVIPGMDYTQGVGFVASYLYQIFEVLLVVTFAFLPMFHFLTFYVLFGCFHLDCQMIRLRDFNDKLTEINFQTKPIDRIHDLKKLIKMHQTFKEFIGNVDVIFAVQNLLDLLSISFQSITILFFCTTEFWAQGYGIVFAIVTPVFMTCAYGVVLETKGNKLVESIYELNWHLLRVTERRLIVLYLVGTQKMKYFSFGSYLPVNFDTFAKTMKFCANVLIFLVKRQSLHNSGN
ncbi:odorant receptor 94a-like [Culicoides brevitarsis]|uniref:odorant receptor 94a-like n=1 Tax=Culicoides brevitarsis TaxID=469753 RepID=UPI00307BA4FA